MDINTLFKQFMQDPEFAAAFNEPLEEEYNEADSQGQILKRGDLSEYKISDEELEEVRNRDMSTGNLKEALTKSEIQEIVNDIVDRMDSNLKDANNETTDIEFEISTISDKEISKIFRLLDDICSDKYIDYEIQNEETYSEGKYYYAILNRKYPDDYYFDYEDEETTWATQPGQRTGKYRGLKEEYTVSNNGGGYIYIYNANTDEESGVDFGQFDIEDLISKENYKILIDDNVEWQNKLPIIKKAARETGLGYGSNAKSVYFKNVPEDILKTWVEYCVNYLKKNPLNEYNI